MRSVLGPATSRARIPGRCTAKLVHGVVGLGFAAGLTFALSAPALAAVSATLSPTTATPGDIVTLTTQEWVSAGPVYLVSAHDFETEIARFGGQVCGAPEQRYLGRLTERSDTGSLSFRLPDVPKGDFYFELQVQKGCWRVAASEGGPLVLTVADHPPARALAPQGAPPARRDAAAAGVSVALQILVVVTGAALVSGLLTAVLLIRRTVRKRR